jgi:hypothetical protein
LAGQTASILNSGQNFNSRCIYAYNFPGSVSVIITAHKFGAGFDPLTQTTTMQMFKQKPSLVLCIIMDLLGCATYLLPGLGEWFDIIWAPISGIVFFIMFGGWKGALGGLFDFAEEILPGTDIIPTFTIAWILKYQASKKKISAIHPITNR